MHNRLIRKKHLLTYQRMSYVHESEEVSVDTKIIDCSYGINPFGYSAKISGKLKIHPNEINNYPLYPYSEIRKKIAEYWGDVVRLNPDCITIGNGSMGIINTINKVFVSEGTVVLGYAPQFTDYIADVCAIGGTYECVELRRERNYKFDSQELMNKVGSQHGIIYIDNPNNPSGQVIPLEEIRSIVEMAEKKQICVIIDEAYGDFMSKQNSAIALTKMYENVFVIRSLSKGFGLAGLRLGYAVCSHFLVPFYQKMNTPFSVSDFVCRIAMKALQDKDFIMDSVRKIENAKKKLVDACNRLCVWNTDTKVPILVLQHPDKGADLFRMFRDKGILTEAGTGFMGLGKNAVRLRIPVEIDRLVEVVREIEKLT